jgi:hypothetical protein
MRPVTHFLKPAAKALLGPAGIRRLRDAGRYLSGERRGIPEVAPVPLAPSALARPRLNLVLPAIGREQRFGGISTALEFFEELVRPCDRARLIVTAPLPRGEGPPAGYRPVRMGDDVDVPRQIVSTSVPGGRPLPVGDHDVFVCTAWWTAYAVQRWIRWQGEHFSRPPRPLVYLIQDYEPGFYPWSERYLLASSTYSYAGPTVAVFNTELLREYVRAQGHAFTHEYSFEPRMPRVLWERRPRSPSAKQRRILVYGRPSVPRNAFELVVQALRLWSERFPGAAGWSVESAGEAHADVRLHRGVVLRSLGKLGLEEYSRTLEEAAVGLSLMVSPHPSYPPLEMAHHGMWVLTNRFHNKDLSGWHDNVTSLGDCSPESIAGSLIELCERVEADPMAGWQGRSRVPHYLSDDPPFPFMDRVREALEVTGAG